MSYSLNHNSSHTASGYKFSPTIIADTDFRLIDVDKQSVTYGCVSSPIDRPDTVKRLVRPISNIYNITAGKNIARTEQAPLKRGIHLEYSRHQTWSKEDLADSAAPKYALPIASKLILDIPVDDLITESDLQQFIGDSLGNLLAENGESSDIISMMKGMIRID